MLELMTHYEQECRRVCLLCAQERPKATVSFHWSDNYPGQTPCLATTESEFAERMAQEAKDARDNLAALVQGYPTFPEVQAERDKLAQEVQSIAAIVSQHGGYELVPSLSERVRFICAANKINCEESERLSQEVERLKAKQSITFGDLSPLVQELIEPHEWDNMNISKQRNWALEMLVATIVSIEDLPDSQAAQANLEAEITRLREALPAVRKAMADVFGGMGKSSAIWSNNPYDKGHTAGVLSALTAFDTAALAATGEPKCSPE